MKHPIHFFNPHILHPTCPITIIIRTCHPASTPSSTPNWMMILVASEKDFGVQSAQMKNKLVPWRLPGRLDLGRQHCKWVTFCWLVCVRLLTASGPSKRCADAVSSGTCPWTPAVTGWRDNEHCVLRQIKVARVTRTHGHTQPSDALTDACFCFHRTFCVFVLGVCECVLLN